MRFKWKSVAFVMAGLLSAAASAVDVALPGMMPGSATVTPSGSAGYKIPLSLPPSLGGFLPRLSFDYTSTNQTQSGLMGVGWSVGGLQQIGRCPQTRAQDTQLKSVSFTESDRFCLNGSRLIKVAGAAYGADGTEYRTEIDTIAKVVSYGTAGTGPQYFKVWQKDGSVLEFGNTSDSRLMINSTDAGGAVVVGTTVLAWGLNRVEDARTNYWTASYSTSMGYGVLYPTEVRYTGNVRAGALPANKVVFNYATRPAGDDTFQFMAGSLIKQSHRISTVTTYADSQLAAEYRFRYQAAAVAFHSRIDEIKECHLKDGNYHCLDPVQISWSSREQDLSVPWVNAHSYSTNFAGIPSSKYDPIVADVDGDARADIVYPAVQSGVLELRVMRAAAGANATTFSAPVSSSFTTSFPAEEPKSQLADLNLDGKADLVLAFIGASGFKVYSFLSNGDGTFATPTVDSISSASLNGTYRFMVTDVNADGVADFAAMKADIAAAVAEVRVAKRDAAGAVAAEQVSTITLGTWASPILHDMTLGDSNGDGYPDALISVRASGSDYGVYTSLSDGNGGFGATASAVVAVPAAALQNSVGLNTTNYWATLIDVNRDGLVDVLVDQTIAALTEYPNTLAWYQSMFTGVARGDGSFAVKGVAPAYAKGTAVPAEITGWIPVYQDFDGNGTLDMLRMGVDNSAQWWMLLTSGNATGEFSNVTVQFRVSNAVPTPAVGVAAMGSDMNADGVPDIILPMVVDGGSGNQKLSAVVTRTVDDDITSLPKQQNLVTKLTRGTVTETFTYSPLPWDMTAASPLYVMDHDSAYPVQDLNMPLMVVSSTSTLRNSVVQETSSYKYKGAKADIANGRGFLGFREVVATTATSAKRADGSVQQLTREQLTRYRQDFPYTGMPVLTTTKANNVLVATSESAVPADFSVLSSYPGVYQPQLNRVASTSYDPSTGALLSTGEQIRHFDPSGFGNIVDESTTTTAADLSDMHSVSVVNTYVTDTANWRVSQQASQSATFQRTGRPTIVKAATYGYDADGVKNQEVTEPGTPSLRVQTDYSHDTYGNVELVTVSGSGDPASPDTAIQSRSVQMLYEAGTGYPAGVFNTSEIKKPSAAAANQVMSRTFDPLTGAVKTQTDANNLTTSFASDAIGRETSRTNPDGSTGVTDRIKCTSFSSLGTGTTGCEVNEYIRTTITQTGMAPVYVFTDDLGREVRKVARAFDGTNYVIARTEYDEAGRVKRTSKPALNTVSYAAQQWTAYEYDSVGRVTKQTLPGSRVTSSAYSGLVTVITNPKSQLRTETRNIAGELWQIKDAHNKLLTYELDALGRITRTTDAKGNQIVFALDKLGRKLQQEDPDLGTWQYRYNVLGELVWQRDASATPKVTTYTYDLMGRRTSQLASDLSSYWEYDAATTGKGKLSRAYTKLSDGTMDYQRIHVYDAHGRPLKEATTPGANRTALPLERSYDAAGRVAQLIYPGTVGYKNVYDQTTGLLKEVRDLSSNALYWTAQAQDAEGHISRELLGNGLTTIRTYKADSGLIDTVQTGVDNATTGFSARVQNDVYGFDSLGNLQTRMEMLNNRVETFDYDGLNRLQNVYEDGALVQSATYDEIGNLMSRSDVGAYSYVGCGGAHRVCQAGSLGNFSYGDNGNMSSGRGNAYTWLSFNKPSRISNSVSQQDFVYDADQERVRRTASWTEGVVAKESEITYLNPRIDLGGTFEREKREDGSITDTWHVYAGGTAIAAVSRLNGVSTVRYLHADHIGSVATLTDAAGLVVERRSYDAWGLRRPIFGDDQSAVTVQWQSDLSVQPTTSNPNTAGITMPAPMTNYGGLIKWLNQALMVDVRTAKKRETPSAIGQTNIGAASNLRQRGTIALATTNPSKRYLSFATVNSGTGAGLRSYGLLIRGTTAYAQKCQGITGTGEPSCTESSLGLVRDGATYTVEVLSTGSTAMVRMYTAGNALNPEFIKAEALDWTAGNTPGMSKTLRIGASGQRAWLPLGGVMLSIKGRGSVISVDNLALETYVPATSLKSQLSRHGFTGHEMLDDQALIHMNGRVYDPVIGRFVSADPNVFYPENMQDFNRYSYVHNNPLSFTDPSGFMLGVSDSYLASQSVDNALDLAMFSSFNSTLNLDLNLGLINLSTGDFNSFGANAESGALGNSQTVSFSFGTLFTGKSYQVASCDVCLYLLTGINDSLSFGTSTMYYQSQGADMSYTNATSFQVGQGLGMGAGLFLGGYSLWGKALYATNAELTAARASTVANTAGAMADDALRAGEFTYTRTAGNHINDIVTRGAFKGELSRPYMNSPLTIREIMSSGKGVPDPGGLPGALRYDVPGQFRGTQGNWELVVDPKTNTIYHFLFGY